MPKSELGPEAAAGGGEAVCALGAYVILVFTVSRQGLK